MGLGVHVFDHLLHNALGVNQHGHAPRIAVTGSAAGPIRNPQSAIGVAQEREVEVKLLGERAIVVHVVKADAVDRYVLGVVILFVVAKLATFDRSAGGVGFGVKPKEHAGPAQVVQANDVAIISRNLKERGFATNFNHCVLRRG